MKKAKKPKARALDRIVAQLRTVLRRETPDVISAGNLLIESRKHLEHGEWQDWLAENFDLSLRSAQNRVAAAEYAARVKSKSANVADFSNLALTVLYALAAGHYNEQEEAAILAATRKGRVDQTRAAAIREALAPPPSADDDDDADHDGDDAEDAEDAESAAILDGPPPDVPPPAPIAPPPDFALRAFDQAVTTLKQLVTKPAATFTGTGHSADDLEKVESFIRAVADRAREARP